MIKYVNSLLHKVFYQIPLILKSDVLIKFATIKVNGIIILDMFIYFYSRLVLMSFFSQKLHLNNIVIRYKIPRERLQTLIKTNPTRRSIICHWSYEISYSGLEGLKITPLVSTLPTPKDIIIN